MRLIPKPSHSWGHAASLFTGLAGLGFFAFVGCTRSVVVGSSAVSDLHPGQPIGESEGGTTGSGGSTGTCTGLGGSSGLGGASGLGGTIGTGGTADGGTSTPSAVAAACPTISTTPGQVNACGRTFGIAYSPDGQLLATATETPNPSIHIWRLSDGALVQELAGHGSEGSFSVAFSPDGTILATSGWAPAMACGGSPPPQANDPTVVKLWDVSTGALLRAIPAAVGNYADAATFSHDGTRLVTAGGYETIQVWNVADGSLLTTIPVTTTFYNVRFSPDDTRVIGAGMGSGGVWNAATGALVFSIAGLEDEMNDAAYSPDGSRIVTTGDQGNLQVFDANGALLQSIQAQSQPTPYFSQLVWVDNNHFVNDDWGGNVRSWTRNAAGTFVASGTWSLASGALGLAGSPDGTQLAVAGGGGFMFISYQPTTPAAVVPPN